MLTLSNIHKHYDTGAEKVTALKGVSVSFRKNEFVSILGPSGCGKTTLLNIIGGLDRYDDGDMSIRGRSTKEYRDRDWDAYRNHSVGFVFQTYNLIPHQTVLSNVEMSLTLTGVSKKERRQRAIEVLNRVGLSDQLNKKPSQMSGGQMQRVAIARALINNPDILLADEPTGALDSETSVQIMEILKEIAKDKLVIMVTHNPDLANEYSTRIIRLLDGRVVSDSAPAEEETEIADEAVSKKKPSMSYFTALALSLNNLLTKKTRTILVSFAGSIGIIGIALILSMSTGVQEYINRVEEETLSSYPITITGESLDTSSLIESMMGQAAENANREEGYIYSGEIMTDLFSAMLSEVEENDLPGFKARIDNDEYFRSLVSGVSYKYNMDLNIWSKDLAGVPLQVNPSNVLESMTGTVMSGETNMMMSTMNQMSSTFGGRSMNVWTELMNNQELLNQQYDVIAGKWPEEKNEVVLVVNSDNTISDLTLYTLGLKPQEELDDMFKSIVSGGSFTLEKIKYSYDQLLDLTFQLVLPTDYYRYDENQNAWIDQRSDAEALNAILENALTLDVVGIIRPSEDSVVSGMNGGSIGYLSSLTKYVIEGVNDSEIMKAQLADTETDVFTGLPFKGADAAPTAFDMSTLTEQQKAMIAQMSPEQLQMMMAKYMPAASDATLEDNLYLLGASDETAPSTIIIYPKDFEAKEEIERYIDAYNAEMEAAGKEGSVIRYTDYIGIMLSGVTNIINAITYVLIAFVAISLVVSSIMIGVITYISVLERTKEIGILRAMGASKRDISRVFNAETTIIGFLAGGLGIFVSWVLVFPINAVIEHFSGIAGMAILPGNGAAILVAVSILLTLISGLIPSRLAAKRDPVEALRSE
ncbi:MAG: ABC transporter ATP-binding protein/permease [Clostridia bacterium]|nr:ABC transporter ATP-binding protein/permease [Clostridia bacterium]